MSRKKQAKEIRVIGLTGKMGSGKTAAAELIKKMCPTAAIYKFAQPMYDIQAFIYQRAGLELKEKDRKLLQYLGTDWGRSKDPNLWVNLWYRDVKGMLTMSEDIIILVDDVRFDNEAAAVHELGGMVIEMRTDKKRIKQINTGHASENGISPKYVDAIVINNASKKKLAERLDFLLSTADTTEDCFE